MEPHPTSPFLATCGELSFHHSPAHYSVSCTHEPGLDDNIKVISVHTFVRLKLICILRHLLQMWIPSSNQWPQTMKGIKQVFFFFCVNMDSSNQCFFNNNVKFQRICTNMKDRKMEQKRAHDHDGADGVDSSVIWLIIRQLRERQRSALNGNFSTDLTHVYMFTLHSITHTAAADSDEDDNEEEDADRDEAQQCIPS